MAGQGRAPASALAPGPTESQPPLPAWAVPLPRPPPGRGRQPQHWAGMTLLRQRAGAQALPVQPRRHLPGRWHASWPCLPQGSATLQVVGPGARGAPQTCTAGPRSGRGPTLIAGSVQVGWVAGTCEGLGCSKTRRPGDTCAHGQLHGLLSRCPAGPSSGYPAETASRCTTVALWNECS